MQNIEYSKELMRVNEELNTNQGEGLWLRINILKS